MLDEKEIEHRIKGRQVAMYYARLHKNKGSTEQEFLDSVACMNILDEFPFLEPELEHLVYWIWNFYKR